MTKDEYTFREAAETDFQMISEFLARYDFGPRKPDWLRWKYQEDPHGQARIFVVENLSKEIKGLLAYAPHLYRREDSSPFTVMQAVDGFLAPEVRGKQLYPRLLQYSMNAINDPMIGFPNKRAENIHVRCGWQILAPEERWYFPGTVGELLVETPFAFIGPLVNMLSRIYALLWLGRNRPKVEMRPIRKFEKSLVIGGDQICGIRSADLLNWRFINNPLREYWAYEFLIAGTGIGYCVFGLDGSSAEIFDFGAIRRQRGCYRKLVEHCRSRRITHLIFRGVGLRLWKFGFVPRASVCNYIGKDLPDGPWLITLCDSDW